MFLSIMQSHGTASRPQLVDEDDDEYEPKSVRDIKQMFNTLSKTSSRGQYTQSDRANAYFMPYVLHQNAW